MTAIGLRPSLVGLGGRARKPAAATSLAAPLAGAALLAAVLVALGFFWLPLPFRPRSESLRLSGVVEIQEVRLGSKIGGRVAEVLVIEGDIAQPGQVLVRFEAPELEAQRDQW